MPIGTQRKSYFLVSAGLIAGLFLTHAAPAAGLNDSGQSLCYNGTNTLVACDTANTGDAAPYPGQDGRYGRDAAATAGALTKSGGGAAGFDFTRICNSGDAAGSGVCPAEPVLGPNPTNWGCTRDNTTGMTWEMKTDDGGLRDKEWTYAWYSTDTATNGGDVGGAGSDTCGGTLSDYANQCNTANYITAVNAAPGLCGFTDWRLPSVRELQTLIHYGATNPTIDTTYFPNTLASDFWSASSYGPSPANAWYVYFGDGIVDAFVKADGFHVRLVRGGQF